MYIQHKMRNTSLLLIFSMCLSKYFVVAYVINSWRFAGLTLVAVTFQQTEALRRIKRGSIVTQNKTKPSTDLLDTRNASNNIHFNEHTLNSRDSHEDMKGHSEHTWARKAVAAVEHAIDQGTHSHMYKLVNDSMVNWFSIKSVHVFYFLNVLAFASLSHKSDTEKAKKNAMHDPNKPKDGSIAGNDLHMTALSHLLANRGLGTRFFDDMQRDAEFAAGEGPAEVLIIDNGFQPLMGMQHGINSYSLHQPNLHSVASSLPHLADIGKDSKLNNLHSPKLTTYTSGINVDNNLISVKHSNDNGISALNGNKEVAVVKNNKRNDNNGDDNRGEYKTVDSHKRKNEHVTLTSGEHNEEAKHNSVNNSNNHFNSNNDELIGGKSHSTNTLQQDKQQLQKQTLQEQPVKNKDSFPALLSHSHKPVEVIGETNNLQEELQGLQQRKKHHSEKSVEVGNIHREQQAATLPKKHQQQVQVVKHSNGKMLPMESFLKFANMMLYKMGAGKEFVIRDNFASPYNPIFGRLLWFALN